MTHAKGSGIDLMPKTTKALVKYSDVVKWRAEWRLIELYQAILALAGIGWRLDNALGRLDARQSPSKS